jgi:hypothetical protein
MARNKWMDRFEQYDTVWFECPKCKNVIKRQVRAGACLLNDYEQDSVPVEIARELASSNAVYCEWCKQKFDVKVRRPERVWCYLVGKE